MVDQLTLQTMSIVISSLGMIIALTYYALQIRNQNTTRQAQLLMQINNQLREEKFQNYLVEMRLWEAEDYDDMMEKYLNPEAQAKQNYVTSFFEGVGLLVERKLLDPKLVYDLMATYLFNYWNKAGKFLEEFRVRANRPEVWKKTENLYKLMMKMYEEEYGHEYAPKQY